MGSMESRILTDWTRGTGLPGVLVIDGHVHVGEWPHATTFTSADEAGERSATFMAANGVDAFCAVGGGYMWEGADYRLGNDFLLDVWKRLPERMIPFLSVNPNDTWDRLGEELDRMCAAGVRCIKLINAYQENYPGDGPNLMRLYEYAAGHRMIVFNHHWTNEVVLKISRRFPSVDFIFAHYGPHLDPVLKDCDNVYSNIWSYWSMGVLDRAIESVGAGKLMMGSDAFLNPMSVGIGPVVFARASDDDKRAILGLNIARLLDKVGALPEGLRPWLG
jgi:predicted TIM-barrel fold metal-dependent hydrolase